MFIRETNKVSCITILFRYCKEVILRPNIVILLILQFLFFLASAEKCICFLQESLFVLYPLQDEEDMIERRFYPDVPLPHSGHRIQVKCINLRLELEIEPIFATMALYDLRDKKKISENFCFDMNPDPLKKMLNTHIPYQVSTVFFYLWPMNPTLHIFSMPSTLC